ncbi:hypothetical protein [Alicyclobacillus sp. SO9]|uniref:hypothetical protein n=1 Tax=Alicyclobacillus sp. SO9 TaxID=2665646 RepID=UPI0018E7F901|nr:hypothetical protein [Alicyclobacillus sp. SO9]QQE78692.1 hypothetical protein GI364_23035 [Alicyclobacillus sp. SO9]
MKRVTALLGFVSILVPIVTGCGTPHFAVLGPNPSSIVVKSYIDPNSTVHRPQHTYILTGSKMTTLYKSLQQAAKHVLPKHWSASCPTYTSNTVVWDYHIVVHYANHNHRSFNQTDTGCSILKDEQTGAMELGALPELKPFGNSSQQWLNGA